MGESFLGHPNRFRIIGSQGSSNEIWEKLDTLYNPNHALSAYYGYRIGKEYLNRKGGMPYVMTGTFHSLNILPSETYRNNSMLEKPSIGDATNKYNHMYANCFHGALDGNAVTASKLQTARRITVALNQGTTSQENTGYTDFDGSSNVTINVKAPYLHVINGGFVAGATTFKNGLTVQNTLNTYNILPDVNAGISSGRNIGGAAMKYNNIYANNFRGNADYASRFKNPVRIKLDIDANYTPKDGYLLYGNEGDQLTGGSGVEIKATVKNVLKLTGGNLTGTLGVKNVVSSGLNGSYIRIVGNHSTPITVNGVSIDDSGAMIDMYCDDISTDIIYAGNYAALNPEANNQSWGIRMMADTLSIEAPSTRDDNHRWIRRNGKNLFNLENQIALVNTDEMDGRGNLKCGNIDCFDIDCSSLYPNYINTRGNNIRTDGGNIYTYNNEGTVCGTVHTYRVVLHPDQDNHISDANERVAKLYLQSVKKKANGSSNSTITLNGGVELNGGSISLNGTMRVNGSTVHGSDIRSKSNISVIDRITSTNIISKMIPTTFTYNDFSNNNRGFIAQQVKESMIELGQDKYFYSDPTDNLDPDEDMSDAIMTINYIEFIPDLINTCQYLLAKVDNLEVTSGLKKQLEYPELQKENEFDEVYYREHAEEIANM